MDYGNDSWLRGSAQGAQWAQSALDHNLRIQELKSQEALRRVQEQQAAAQLERALWLHGKEIEEDANNQKSAAIFQSLITPTIQAQVPVGLSTAEGTPMGGTMEVANPHFTPSVGEAYMRAYLPTSHNPDKVVLNAATLELRQSQLMNSGVARPRTAEQIEADRELAHQRRSAAELNESKKADIGKGKVGVDPEWVRGIKFMDDLREKAGQPPLSIEEKDRYFKIHSGLAPRAAVTKPPMSKSEYVGKGIDKMLSHNADVPKSERVTRDQAISVLEKEYDKLYPQNAAPSGRVRKYNPTTGKLE